ncbi:YdiU family protein [Roseovarius sp. SCSIO 43702]|uniref:protein adenylyltransferase SelO n=1 Tax=Roseovarius sp. SCSIO 43702 TaxID=2823043 RepID=UPI001C73B3E2|nr:YdiU family protein [Roseovarius sp. SCSIO 43702]QYX55405.1 YdiU family protein [Roseovarius sp. SCSIO 43702]
MTLTIPFDNSYATLPAGFYTRLDPTPVKAPALVAFNRPLADELGIDTRDTDEADLTAIFSGNAVPEGAAPLAQLYAGHQFGGFSPQLGDGRAILLGEVIDRHGKRRDIQLKGSGPTPYSRMGDGRAWLGPVLREYVVSEAMHALGIPTTRALAAVTTGEPVFREEGGLPGAVLTRVAASHIRVGTFQVFLARRDLASLRRLFDYTRARHYPETETPAQLLRAVIARQARLIAAWEGVGFIHGVMNTDNTALSGETIDYGPCAFMDRFHPDTVFSSIDAHGRYAYSNQRNVIVWNLAQFATCLVPLHDDQDAAVEEMTRDIHAMPDLIARERRAAFGCKIGLAEAAPEDQPLIDELLALMTEGQADFTNTFRALADGDARDQVTDRAAFDAWAARWQARLETEEDPTATMRAANPWVIPRNHRIEQMIEAAVAGDLAPFERLMDALATPYEAQPAYADLTRPPTPSEVVQRTFCGT